MRISCVIWPEPSLGRRDFDAGEGGLLHRVGGENGLRDLLEVIGLGAERCGKLGHARRSAFPPAAERR